MENNDKSTTFFKILAIFGLYVLILTLLLIYFTDFIIDFIPNYIEPNFEENAKNTLIASILYIVISIFICVIFNICYFILARKFVYKNIYDTSSFLTFITGIYTTMLAMLNILVSYLNNHNGTLKQQLPNELEKYNNYFFIIFLFLVVTSITLNFLKSQRDIKEKRLREKNKNIIYSSIECFTSDKNKEIYYKKKVQKKDEN